MERSLAGMELGRDDKFRFGSSEFEVPVGHTNGVVTSMSSGYLEEEVWAGTRDVDSS